MRISLEVYSKERLYSVLEEMVELGYDLGFHNWFDTEEWDWVGFDYIEEGGIYVNFDTNLCVLLNWDDMYLKCGTKRKPVHNNIINTNEVLDLGLYLEATKMGLM